MANVPRRSDPVFYNPRQALNRDLSILILLTWQKLGFPSESIVEAFAGSGIRALRYVLQGPKFDTIFVNDITEQAIELCQKNFNYHQVKLEEKGSTINFSVKSAQNFFKEAALRFERFDVIDIDPFGTPQPYIRSALETLGAPGLLAITATDMPVITGLYPDKAYKIYQIPGFKIKNRSYCHEIGLRMFVAYLQREGLALNKFLIPILSYYCDHYIRVFVRRQRGGKFESIYNSHGYLLECTKCGARETFRWPDFMKKTAKCYNCQHIGILIGPLFLGSLHEKSFLDELLHQGKTLEKNLFDRQKRLERLLKLLKEDLLTDQVWFYDKDWLGQRFKTSLPSTQEIIDKLREHGFQASLTHFSGNGIKTNYALELNLPKFLNRIK
jgi:tRNA (guanine26-N2/guanine27-N2)-dimethyltransferase